jgi:hypothetical protein
VTVVVALALDMVAVMMFDDQLGVSNLPARDDI